MIQRKQSLCWLLVGLISVCMSMSTIVFFKSSFKNKSDFFEISTAYNKKILDTNKSPKLRVSTINFYPKYSLILLAILSLASVFLYKNRKLQMKLCFVQMGLVCIVMFFMVQSSFLLTKSLLENTEDAFQYQYLPSACLPFSLIIFEILAYRFTAKDEKIVNSLNRLR